MSEVMEQKDCDMCPYSIWVEDYQEWVCNTASGMCILALQEEEDW